MLKRELVEELRQRKIAMVSALWSNSNWDPQKEGEQSPREAAIAELEENFNEAVLHIYGQGTAVDEEDIDWDDPFWAAAKRGVERITGEIPGMSNEGYDPTVGEVIRDEYDPWKGASTDQSDE